MRLLAAEALPIYANIEFCALLVILLSNQMATI